MSPRTAASFAWKPAGFFVLRTPLLPLCPADGAAVTPSALAADPVVREALFVASPGFDEALSHWREDPTHPRAHDVVAPLARYLARMRARPTPFGLFSACSTGELGGETRLEVARGSASHRRTRLDTHYLCALVDALAADPARRATLRFRPSSGLYASGSELRYAEARVDRITRARSYHMVAVTQREPLALVLARAADGARPAELAHHLATALDGVTDDEALAFVGELIDAQLLVPELAPALTGAEPARGVLDALRALDAPEAAPLADALAALDRLDRAGPGASPSAYRDVARGLAALPAPSDPSRLFQVDLHRPARATLGPAVVDAIAEALAALAAVTPDRGDADLAHFRARFEDRWGNTEVPLMEALDEERGIGFGADALAAETSPLLDGLPFASAPAPATVTMDARAQQLLRGLEATLCAGRTEWALDARDVAALAAPGRPLPDAFAAVARLAAASPEALARGEFALHLVGATGPSGARLLGRFCHGDDALRAHVERHLRAEEALRPDAIFAEVVHLPDGRDGNVLARPVLRAWEIPYLGRSGAPRDRQLALDDLTVSVASGRVILRARRLDREVIPRLTAAHSAAFGLTAYRFLLALQGQGARTDLAWDWGPLAAAPYLPRVRLGRAVLSLARWSLTPDDLRPLAADTAEARRHAVRSLRDTLRLPRRVSLVEGDHVLPVDLDDDAAVDAFATRVGARDRCTLQEEFGGPDALCVEGPDGRYTHELVVPFERVVGPSATGAPSPAVRRYSAGTSFPPGSAWLYAKVYAGTATADAALTEALHPTVARLLDAGGADRWFFIRYADPEWHLRVRIHGDPTRLWGEGLPALHAALEPLRADGRVVRWSLDTYDREVERYGGDAGVACAEEIFYADSEAVAAVLAMLSGDGGAVARWQLAARSVRDLLRDLGLDRARRVALFQRLRDEFGRRCGIDADLEHALGRRFREERAALESLLAARGDDDHPLAPAVAVFERRSEAVARVASELNGAPLTAPLDTLAESYAHMALNRLLRSDHQAQELVLYDLLLRLERGEEARARSRDRATA